MPTWLRVILIIVLVLILAVAVAAFIGYRWVESHKGAFKVDGAALIADAARVSQGRDANACVTEALSRADRCDSTLCQAQTKVFLGLCLSKTGTPPDFCAGVPKRTYFFESTKWPMAECARRGRPNDQRCAMVILAVQEECWRKR